MNCITKNCTGKLLAKGLCVKCYYRVKRGGTPEVSKKQQEALRVFCIENCGKSHTANGLCLRHYRLKKRNGDPRKQIHRFDGGYAARKKLYIKQWKKDNWDYYKSYLAARKQRVKQATPPWTNLEEIIKIYQERPNGCHVDHIVPINGKDVSGLNVPWNLQYLSASDNLKKSNKI